MGRGHKSFALLGDSSLAKFQKYLPVSPYVLSWRNWHSEAVRDLCPLGLSFLLQAWCLSPSHIENIMLGAVMMLGKQRTNVMGQMAGTECTNVEEKLQTYRINTHKYPVKPKLPSGFPVSFLYEPLEHKDNSNCPFTDFIQVGNKQPARHARISWSGKCGFDNSSLSLFNLLFCIFPLHYKAFKEKCFSDKQVFTTFKKSVYCQWLWKQHGGHPLARPWFEWFETKCLGKKLSGTVKLAILQDTQMGSFQLRPVGTLKETVYTQ